MVVTNTPIQNPTLVGTSTSTALPANTATASNTSTSATYDDRNSVFVYSSGWTNVHDSRAYRNQYKLTQTVNSYVTVNFSGQRFSIIYNTGPAFGGMAVYVDGNLLYTLNQNTSTVMYQQRWSYGGTLTVGAHTLKLVFVGPSASKVSLDAVSIP
jgi:hypothetical protein